jgi:hypothetical protein
MLDSALGLIPAAAFRLAESLACGRAMRALDGRPADRLLAYEDFREAWLPDQGFDFPTRVVSAQNVQNEREVITIGFSELSEAEAEAQLQRIGPQERRRHERIDEVVEPEMTRRFYVQVAEDDFTNATTED